MSKNTKAYQKQRSSYLKKLVTLGFDITQVTNRAENNWSLETTEAVLMYSKALRKAPYHLSHQQIIQIADRKDSAKVIESIYSARQVLLRLHVRSSDLVDLVNNCRSVKNIEALRYSSVALKKLGFSADHIIILVKSIGGDVNIRAIQDVYEHLHKQRRPLDSIKQIMHDANRVNNVHGILFYSNLLYALSQPINQTDVACNANTNNETTPTSINFDSDVVHFESVSEPIHPISVQNYHRYFNNSKRPLDTVEPNDGLINKRQKTDFDMAFFSPLIEEFDEDFPVQYGYA